MFFYTCRTLTNFVPFLKIQIGGKYFVLWCFIEVLIFSSQISASSLTSEDAAFCDLSSDTLVQYEQFTPEELKTYKELCESANRCSVSRSNCRTIPFVPKELDERIAKFFLQHKHKEKGTEGTDTHLKASQETIEDVGNEWLARQEACSGKGIDGGWVDRLGKQFDQSFLENHRSDIGILIGYFQTLAERNCLGDAGKEENKFLDRTVSETFEFTNMISNFYETLSEKEKIKYQSMKERIEILRRLNMKLRKVSSKARLEQDKIFDKQKAQALKSPKELVGFFQSDMAFQKPFDFSKAMRLFHERYGRKTSSNEPLRDK